MRRLFLLWCLASTPVYAAPNPAGQLIASLHMAPIPQEGGWFAQVWRSSTYVAGDAAHHPQGTAIIVLETREGFSAFHRLKTDEIWHYSAGDPIELVLLYPDGTARRLIMSADEPMAVVPAGTWQASRPVGKQGWSLGGTSMAPGFVPGDFELGERAALLARYPAQKASIMALTRGAR